PQFFRSPHAKELVETNRLSPVIGAGHRDFSGCRPLMHSSGSALIDLEEIKRRFLCGLLGRLHSNWPVQRAIILTRRGWRLSMLTEQAHALVDQFAKALELVGVAIILGGIIVATVTFLRDGSRTRDWRSAYPGYRSDVGRGILLGLEFLLGADIISTITAPLTFESVGLLAAKVAIRTFLSFSLETEIEGCWPWQRATKDVGRSLNETDRYGRNLASAFGRVGNPFARLDSLSARTG